MNVFIVFNEVHSGTSKCVLLTINCCFAYRQCFRQWRETIREEKDDRQLAQYALDHYNRVLKRKVLLAWNNEMIQQISIENENEMKLNKYKEEKNLLSLQMIYHRWKNVTNERTRTRFLNQRAQRFYEHNLLRNIFSLWREEHQLNMRIKVSLMIDRIEFTVFSFGSYLNDKPSGSIECDRSVESFFNGNKPGNWNNDYINRNIVHYCSGQ